MCKLGSVKTYLISQIFRYKDTIVVESEEQETFKVKVMRLITIINIRKYITVRDKRRIGFLFITEVEGEMQKGDEGSGDLQ